MVIVACHTHSLVYVIDVHVIDVHVDEAKVSVVEMRVFRGRLVHCKVPERIEVLEDQLIGFIEKDLGRVSEFHDDVCDANWCKRVGAQMQGCQHLSDPKSKDI